MARRAIIVGSNGPAGTSVTQLKYARRDAQAFAAVLGGPQCGFEVHVAETAGKANALRDLIERVADTCTGDDTLLIAFSGHGMVDRGMLLMLDDSDVNKPLTTMLHAEDVVKAMRFCTARRKLLILDCCHAGGLLQGSIFKDAGAKITDIVPGLATPDDTEASTFAAILASDRLEKARELDLPVIKGGFLTHCICQALGAALRTADQKSDDGAIDLEDLKWWLEQSAKDHNAAHPEAKVPTPFIYGRIRKQFYITREPTSWIEHRIVRGNGTELIVIPAFWQRWGEKFVWCIGRTPVTNEQYRRFVDNTGRNPPSGQVYLPDGGTGSENPWVGPFQPWDHDEFSAPNQPVVCVSYEDGRSYAEWLSSCWFSDRWSIRGEFEFTVTPLSVWDIAAFGKPFPIHDRRQWRQDEIHDKAKAPAPMPEGVRRTTPYGAVDLLGNVWEWCGSGRSTPALGLRGGYSIAAGEIRGGSYLDDLSSTGPFLPVSEVPGGDKCRHSDLGFRVAAKVPMSAIPEEIADRVQYGHDIAPG